jgi:ubiquinone/menaquinone biosynthesis C-methylase UbiE
MIRTVWKKLKKILKIIFPKFILDKIWGIPVLFKCIIAYLSFLFAKENPQTLGWHELDKLEKRYFTSDEEISLEVRQDLARKRIQKMLRLLPLHAKPESLLETGAGHGFFSLFAWREYQINCVAIDVDFKVNPEMEKKEIPFLVMDVSHMDFEDNTFDCVVSFDSFEHFLEPEQSLSEMIRVTRPGGFILLDFGSLYGSARGAHLRQSIHVPYCQYLFDPKLLQEYIEANGLKKIASIPLNRYSLQQYNQIWQRFSDRVRILYKRIDNDYRAVELITQYPGLFKSKTRRFRDLLNSNVTILFQKK